MGGRVWGFGSGFYCGAWDPAGEESLEMRNAADASSMKGRMVLACWVHRKCACVGGPSEKQLGLGSEEGASENCQVGSLPHPLAKITS